MAYDWLNRRIDKENSVIISDIVTSMFTSLHLSGAGRLVQMRTISFDIGH